ncbi:MAG: hypothetical protein ACRDYC_13385, partial [Acidimicrobiales bacterium]
MVAAGLPAADLRAAWRLAYLVTGSGDAAEQAVSAALSGPREWAGVPTLVNLLSATYREAGTRVVDEHVPEDQEPAVTGAFWDLSPEHRAATALRALGIPVDTVARIQGTTPEAVGEMLAESRLALAPREGLPECLPGAELHSYLTGELRPTRVAKVEDHLPTCVLCQARLHMYEELEDLPNLLTALVPPVPLQLVNPPLEPTGGTAPVGGREEEQAAAAVLEGAAASGAASGAAGPAAVAET